MPILPLQIIHAQMKRLFTTGTVETIVSGYSAEAMNYEIYNMVEAIKGTQPNRSLFFTTEVIDILDQMQNYGRIKKTSALLKFFLLFYG